MNNEALIKAVTEIAKPIIEELGYIVYHIEYLREGNENYLRVYIDKEEGSITLTDCENVSRKISERMDVSDPIKDQYFFEVSSPGIFRTLFTDEHLNRYIGERVDVNTSSVFKGKRQITAKLVSFDENNVNVDLDGDSIEVPREKIKTINLNNFSFSGDI